MPGDKKSKKEEATAGKGISRRDFLVTSGTVVVADALIAGTPVAVSAAPATSPTPDTKYPESTGYLLYDSKKCAGCTTCMLTCSLVHYGEQSLAFSRIQIAQDSFGKFPNDLVMGICRQCVTPLCVDKCPVKAAHVDTANGNVRVIDSKKCIGCKTCLSACPYTPHRPVWNNEISKSSKCDLCLDTPYWNEKGGPKGKQACVEACPFKAIKFTDKVPEQAENKGYDVKLRNEHWFKLGFADEDNPQPAGGRGGFGGGGFGGGGRGGAPKIQPQNQTTEPKPKE
jgi:protein NrfC